MTREAKPADCLANDGARRRLNSMAEAAETSIDKELRTALQDLLGLEREPTPLRWFTKIPKDIPKADRKARFCEKLDHDQPSAGGLRPLTSRTLSTMALVARNVKDLGTLVKVGLFAVAMGCSSNGSSGGTGSIGDASGGAGPMDGSWNLVSETCNGSSVAVTGVDVSVTLTVHGSSGSWATTIADPGADTCALNILMTFTYPAAGSVTWTYGALTSTPDTCLSDGGSTNVTGMQYTGTYVIHGSQMTLHETTAPETDSACPGGDAVIILQRQES